MAEHKGLHVHAWRDQLIKRLVAWSIIRDTASVSIGLMETITRKLESHTLLRMYVRIMLEQWCRIQMRFPHRDGTRRSLKVVSPSIHQNSTTNIVFSLLLSNCVPGSKSEVVPAHMREGMPSGHEAKPSLTVTGRC